MLIPTHDILERARKMTYAVGAFNVYTIEGIRAVVGASESMKSPVILQVLPSALALAGTSLIAACLEAGEKSQVPVSVHLDHCSDPENITTALKAGVLSIMADGSGLDYEENCAFTRKSVVGAGAYKASVEGELGGMTGVEDGVSFGAVKGFLTEPDEAADFVSKTGISALAVSIGNIHGPYNDVPHLDFGRLKRISRAVSIPLVLHGTSGLPDTMIRQAMDLGVSKFNVNTELRQAWSAAARDCFDQESGCELTGFMETVISAMMVPVKNKLMLFRSCGRA